MNREILFRGKDHYTGEWVEGYLIERNKKSWIVRYSLDQDPIGIINQHWSVNTPSAVVDQKTVGQYIGKTDKNGVKIFEGDILRYSDKYGTIKSTVVYIAPSFNFINKESGLNFNFIEGFEVVGNIYENESN